MKIEIKKASGGEFEGTTYVEELTPAIREALRISTATAPDAVIHVLGSYEVEVDDPADHLAFVMLRDLTLYSPGDKYKVDLSCGDASLNSEELEEELTRRIDWGDYWEDYVSSAADRAYEMYRDREDGGAE